MPVTAWKVVHGGAEWGADGDSITPEALAVAIAAHEDEPRYTYYGKPYVVHASDAQSVWDYFGTEITRDSDWSMVRWEYEDDPEHDPDIIY